MSAAVIAQAAKPRNLSFPPMIRENGYPFSEKIMRNKGLQRDSSSCT
jgi:hypothetical protein